LRRTSPEPSRSCTVPPIEKSAVLQLTTTLPMSALPIVPRPFVTVQAWLGSDGCVRTVTV
jgi:hypothetical protein